MSDGKAVRLTIVRHASAPSRSEFDGPERDRPLTIKGHAQARALAEILGATEVDAILSSPALRCIETVTPLSERLGMSIEPFAALDEDSTGAAALDALIARAGSTDGGIVVGATHGPIFNDLLAAANERFVSGTEIEIRSAGRIQVVVTNGEVTALETFPAPDVDGAASAGGSSS